MMEKIRHWAQDGFALELFDTGSVDHLGKSRLAYVFADGETVIFEGEDFCASPLHAIDSDETVYALLAFLSLQRGDTDTEYFETYSPEQIEWRDSFRCELLSLLAYDFESARQSAAV